MRISSLHPKYGPPYIWEKRKLFDLPLTEDQHIPWSGKGFSAIKHSFTFTVNYWSFLVFLLNLRNFFNRSLEKTVKFELLSLSDIDYIQLDEWNLGHQNWSIRCSKSI